MGSEKWPVVRGSYLDIQASLDRDDGACRVHGGVLDVVLEPSAKIKGAKVSGYPEIIFGRAAGCSNRRRADLELAVDRARHYRIGAGTVLRREVRELGY